ncbi:T9SS type A sorting domain-containing protein [Flavobacterium sp. MFBS3-15]|uniref:T9SS-dependent choice-of-anchor J family protein n=1 Tax=Flavobacterium sp. MFBS3-15 TaxID=2989816 RepID=UPI00223570C1|nr:T9SS type A sorting domain-containing protein [Flavobacterium sp. MFBS3-15]MCW4470174.1 T9SS type A sorting domain-containing protein [Flavobacterium sp. MFBS3-15]
MKKHLLLGALFFGSLMSVHAQNTCDDALQLTAGTTVVGAIDGTYLTFANGGCWQSGATAPNAEWYYIIPDQNSLIRINTNIAANNPVTGDTRISVYTGSCEDLTCYAGNDDVDPDNGPFLSDLTFPAAAGEVYFIAFDDRWSAASFSVEVTVTPTSCFGVETFEYVAAPTTTTATIGWDAPSLGVPTGYIFEYGPMGFTPGTGMTETVSETQIALDGLTPSTDYEFYITTVCGEGNESEVVGPISWSTVFEPANLPYTYGFETPSLNGWSVFTTTGAAGPWDTMVGTSAAWAPQEGETGMAVGAFTTAIDSWLFSRGLNLTANQQVTITYYVRERIGAGNGGVNNLIVTVGNDATVAAQTTTLATHNDFATSTEWSLQTATFTPSATGVYFLGFHCNSPAQVAANFGWITLDNVTVTGTAGTNENLASQLSVFPNPATNVINVINNKNILVNGIQIVDLNGRTVKSAKFDGVTEAQVNISDLANGVYMMTVSSDKGTMTQKIVKN